MGSILCLILAICTPIDPGPRVPAWVETAPIAVPLVARWEGLRTTAYLDTIAEPPVWTICYGETQDVQPGETRTVEECQHGLAEGLRGYWVGFRSGLIAPEVLRPESDAAFTSLTWNIGVGAVNRSTVTKRLNARDVAGACEALTWWNRAGQRVIRGLVNRRADEHRVCMRGTT